MDSLKSTFTKSERLCSKKAIEELFQKGRSFYCNPFQVIWILNNAEDPFPARVALSVSKRSFKRAVIRNIIKRRIRESYRKQKHLLYEFLRLTGRKICFIIIFKGDTIPDYLSTEKSVREIISRLTAEIKKSS